MPLSWPRSGSGDRSGRRLETDDAESRDRPRQALERERADLLALDEVLEGARHTRGDEDLAGLGLVAEPGGEIGDGADGAVVPTPLEADGPERGVALGDPHALRQLVAPLAPARVQVVEPLAHGHRHPD